ncbi:MAG: NAD(P) transhydrogenase subunit alpha [Treponemataceae bacterium]
MIIGVPKEIMQGEARVAATPESCASFIADGHSVLVEKGAGIGSYFLDEAYVKAGVTLVDDVAELYKKADLILKVKEPLFNEKKNCSEISMMHRGQYLITFIHPASPVNHAMVKEMTAAGVISYTLDGVPRISRAQNMDALTSMSTCAGYKGIMIAGNLLPRFMPQIFSAVGMIKPVNVLVIGTGVGGLQALATAKRLGAVIHAADIRPAAREQAQSLGAKVIDLGVDEKEAVGEGGYALHLKESTLQHEREMLAPHVKDMDIIFTSALVPGKIAPKIITEEMVKTMKHGSVIVDISIDQGGNCEITPSGTVETKHGVNLVGIKNIPGMLPESSTWMFAKNIYNLAKYLIKGKELSTDTSDEIVRGILTTIDGNVVHAGAREAMGL